MRIKNIRELSTTPERRAALQLLDAALDACDAERLLDENIVVENNVLRVSDECVNLSFFERIFVVGAGKAAGMMAAAVERKLGNKITDGIIIDVVHRKLKHIRCVKGSHPLPSATNQRAAAAMAKMVQKGSANTLVICLISGGGSVLMADPFASQASAQKTVQALLKSGATIQEINTVRKHLYALAGGNLAAKAFPSRVLSIILSDVVGDDPSLVASGPTVLDKTTVADAKKALKRHHISAAGLRETPKDEHLFNRANNVMLLTNKTAVDAMAQKARELGLQPTILDTHEQGEARAEAVRLVEHAPSQPGQVLLAAGETTVTVKGKGKGGRNQELAAAAMALLSTQQHIALASMGTDGMDHTDAAGAIVDQDSLAMAKKRKLDVGKALEDNDSYTFFKKLGKHQIITGPTGTNVSDIMVVVRGPLKLK
jgi:hydroxypyruvate reductase